MNAIASIVCMSLMLSAGSAMAGPNNFDGLRFAAPRSGLSNRFPISTFEPCCVLAAPPLGLNPLAETKANRVLGSAMAGPNNFDGTWKVHLVTNVSVAVRLLLQQSMSVHYMRTASIPIVLKANLLDGALRVARS